MLQKIKLLSFLLSFVFFSNNLLSVEAALGCFLRDPSEKNLNYFNSWCLENKFGALDYLLYIATPNEKMQYTFNDFTSILSEYQNKDLRIYSVVFFFCLFPRDFFPTRWGTSLKLINIREILGILYEEEILRRHLVPQSMEEISTRESIKQSMGKSIIDLCEYLIEVGKEFKPGLCYKTDQESLRKFKAYIIKSRVGIFTHDGEKGYDIRFQRLIEEIHECINPSGSGCVVS